MRTVASGKHSSLVKLFSMTHRRKKSWMGLYDGSQAPKFSLAAWLENHISYTIFISLAAFPCETFSQSPDSFSSCTDPFEMLLWIYIFRSPLLVMDTYCKLQLIWMILNCIHHSVSQEYVENVSDGAYSRSMFLDIQYANLFCSTYLSLFQAAT